DPAPMRPALSAWDRAGALNFSVHDDRTSRIRNWFGPSRRLPPAAGHSAWAETEGGSADHFGGSRWRYPDTGEPSGGLDRKVSGRRLLVPAPRSNRHDSSRYEVGGVRRGQRSLAERSYRGGQGCMAR